MTTNQLLWTCITLLCVIVILIGIAIIYYFVKQGLFRYKKNNHNKHILGLGNKNLDINKTSLFITNFATTLSKLSSDKVGALIVIENKNNLQKYVEIGNEVHSNFLPELVYSIFYNHKSALHDGAMIIRNFEIVSASSYLPLSSRLLPVKYGARHRAAFGIAERTDALAFVVSETTGQISFMCGADVQILSSDSVKLAHQLTAILFEKYVVLNTIKNPIILEKIKERVN